MSGREAALGLQRSDQEWISALSEPGSERENALADLRALLVRGLRCALSQRNRASDNVLIEDCVQAALIRILKKLSSYRGRSRFPTWAQAVAVHVALTELRRVRWSGVSLEEITADFSFVPESLVEEANPESQAIQRQVVETLQRIVDEELTEKQRRVLIAQERGMSLQEVARRMGCSRGAVYKVLYDARQQLRKRLAATGISADEIAAAFHLQVR